MAIDASIPLQVRPIQVESPFNALTQALQLQNLQRQSQLAQAQMEEQQASAQERNALRAFLQGNPNLDEEAVQRQLYGVAPTQAPGILKGRLELKKTQGEIGKAEAETSAKQFQLRRDQINQHLQGLAGVNSPADVPAWVQSGVASGFVTPEQGQAALAKVPTDPGQFGQWKQRQQMAGLGLAQQMEQEWKRLGYDLDVRQQTERERSARAGESVARGNLAVAQGNLGLRGQELVASREATAATKAERAEAKKLETTEKAVTKFSDTLQKEGIPELETAVSAAEGALGRYKPGQVPGVGRLEGAIPSALLGEEGNDVRQAVATVRNIVLNARSGAAVTDQELRRLVEELGTGIGQSESALRRGLARVRSRLDKIKENAAAGVSDSVLSTYQERGGMPMKRGGEKPPATKPNIDELLKKYQ